VVATFPADYPVDTLADKEATFAVTVKEVAAPTRAAIDDAFAKTFGMETLAQLKEAVGTQIKREYDTASRMKLKRELLDQLDAVHSFELPPTLVDSEFEAMWRQFNENLKQAGKTLEDEGKSEEEARADYRRIAERRVRLGLVIGEIAESSKIEITQDEMRRALIEQARRFPGHEKAVYEYYEKTPGALAELRAPIFEDKVVDFVLEQVNPAEKKVSKEELFKEVEAATAG
jgi:trigger factor